MRKYCAAILLLAVIALNACNKSTNNNATNCADVTTTAPASEVTTLKNYITTNNIDATADSRGFYYHIDNAGSGNKPNACSDITIDYVGKLTNGQIFDQQNSFKFSLPSLILGWQEGVPLISKGGSITLYLPPSLGYGASKQGTIPGNSMLIFQIKLIDF